MSFINTRDIIGDQATIDGIVEQTLESLYENGVRAIASSAFRYNSGLKYVEFPGAVGSMGYGINAFEYCSNLISASLPDLEYAEAYMFRGCSSLTTIYAPKLKSVLQNAFISCINLESVNLPSLVRTGQGAFSYCIKLSSAVFASNISVIAKTIFADCWNLNNVSFSNITSLNDNTFLRCVNLTSVNIPGLKRIGNSAFSGCAKLTSPSFPALSYIGDRAFADCAALMSMSFSLVSFVGNSVFLGAVIDTLCFPVLTSMGTGIADNTAEIDIGGYLSIRASAFLSCFNLSTLILRNSSMCSLVNTNALSGTPIYSGCGYIYVPDELVDTYKSATNWATFASQIVSLGEYPKNITIPETITDSWAEILAAEDNGTYSTRYNIGDTKIVNIGKYKVPMQIVAMDTDVLADDTGNAKITWISLNSPFRCTMDPRNTNTNGWGECTIRTGLMNRLYDHMDNNVKSAIKSVKKTFYDRTINTTKTAIDYIWIPSKREVSGQGSAAESSGCIYSFFNSDPSAVIKVFGPPIQNNITSTWVTRTAYTNPTAYVGVVSRNSFNGTPSISPIAIVFGFCT